MSTGPRQPFYTYNLVYSPLRFQAKSEQLKRFEGYSLERQGQNLASTVLYVPHSPDRDVPWCNADAMSVAMLTMLTRKRVVSGDVEGRF